MCNMIKLLKRNVCPDITQEDQKAEASFYSNVLFSVSQELVLYETFTVVCEKTSTQEVRLIYQFMTSHLFFTVTSCKTILKVLKAGVFQQRAMVYTL